MSNMRYCRFSNTLSDLEDCLKVINDTEDLSESEATARRRLIKLCAEIVEETGY